MSQLNLHINENFEHDLSQLMKLRHISTKSEAIRLAVKESLLQIKNEKLPTDFASWRGAALPRKKRTKPLTDDELWEKHGC